jgi:hypothetical protein
MRFLYLIQGKAANVRKYATLNSECSEVLGLSYDQPEPGFEYFPNSSFATGRNFLLSLATRRIGEFDYLIFLDDDVEFCRGSFLQMEQNLQKFKPAIAVPLTEKTRRTPLSVERYGVIYPLFRWQWLHINDEQYLALSREVVQQGLLLPYLTEWDQQSWFVCCLIQEALIQHYYYGQAVQFNDCEIRNDQHSDAYPHNLEFARSAYADWMRRNFEAGTKRPALYQQCVTLDRGAGDFVQSLIAAVVSMVKQSRIYRFFRGRQSW